MGPTGSCHAFRLTASPCLLGLRDQVSLKWQPQAVLIERDVSMKVVASSFTCVLLYNELTMAREAILPQVTCVQGSPPCGLP